jgi:hypothetical protein
MCYYQIFQLSKLVPIARDYHIDLTHRLSLITPQTYFLIASTGSIRLACKAGMRPATTPTNHAQQNVVKRQKDLKIDGFGDDGRHTPDQRKAQYTPREAQQDGFDEDFEQDKPALGPEGHFDADQVGALAHRYKHDVGHPKHPHQQGKNTDDPAREVHHPKHAVEQTADDQEGSVKNVTNQAQLRVSVAPNPASSIEYLILSMRTE